MLDAKDNQHEKTFLALEESAQELIRLYKRKAELLEMILKEVTRKRKENKSA